MARRRRTQTIPVIKLIALSEERDLARTCRLRADRCIRKAVDIARGTQAVTNPGRFEVCPTDHSCYPFRS